MQKTLPTFVDDIYEDLELWYPKLRCEEAGYAMRVAAPELKTYKGKHGYPAKSELLLKDANSQDFCGCSCPAVSCWTNSAAMPRRSTREFFEVGKLVASICHGGWIPIPGYILGQACHRGRSASRTIWKRRWSG